MFAWIILAGRATFRMEKVAYVRGYIGAMVAYIMIAGRDTLSIEIHAVANTRGISSREVAREFGLSLLQFDWANSAASPATFSCCVI